MQGEVLSAMMRSVYASFAASAKMSSVWPVLLAAERTGRHSRLSVSPPSFAAGPNSLANADAPAIPPRLT